MQFVVAEKPNPPAHRNQYVAKLTFMEGDADAYNDVYLIYDTIAELEDLQATLDWLRSEDPHYNRLGAYESRRNGDDKVNRIYADPRFQKHFGEYSDEWPREREGMGPQAFQRVEYAWWDHNGAEYPIKVVR